jgi:hypothetical protein
MRTHNEIRDESGGRWEVKLDGSLKSVTEKIAENNRAVLDLKNLLLDFWADWEKAAEEPPAFVPGVREEETYRDPAPPKVISLFEPEIPMPVSDYKDRMQKARILKLDRFGVYLEASPEGSGEFLLFRVPDSKFIVVPFFEIFDKPELFSTYYRNFYERTGDQSVGSVWIKKAALVGQTRQGWELLQKGVLEIR